MSGRNLGDVNGGIQDAQGASDQGASDQGASGEVRVAFDPQLCGVEGALETLTFEQLLVALELVTARMASGDLGIEAAADLYEQAEVLHAAARERLAAVEARIARMQGPHQG
jgi:exodeoxyribonuclease VII small subunit